MTLIEALNDITSHSQIPSFLQGWQKKKTTIKSSSCGGSIPMGNGSENQGRGWGKFINSFVPLPQLYYSIYNFINIKFKKIIYRYNYIYCPLGWGFCPPNGDSLSLPCLAQSKIKNEPRMGNKFTSGDEDGEPSSTHPYSIYIPFICL